MFNKLSDLFYRWAKGWLVILFVLLSVFFMVIVMPVAGALLQGGAGTTPAPIDYMFFYTPEKVYGMVEAYGETGRMSYRTVELTLDILYPVVYTLAFALLISWLFKGTDPQQDGGGGVRRLNLVPLGAWFFDLLENLGIAAMLTIYPATPAALAWGTAFASAGKWSFVVLSVVVVVVGVVRKVRGRNH